MGLQGGTLLLINARSCPRFALGNVFEASSNPQCVAASAGLGWAGLCTGRARRRAKARFLTAWGPGTGQQMAQGTSALPPPASACCSADAFGH